MFHLSLLAWYHFQGPVRVAAGGRWPPRAAALAAAGLCPVSHEETTHTDIPNPFPKSSDLSVLLPVSCRISVHTLPGPQDPAAKLWLQNLQREAARQGDKAPLILVDNLAAVQRRLGSHIAVLCRWLVDLSGC